MIATWKLALLAMMATLTVQADRSLAAGDFNWEITPEDGFPSIAFDDASASKEVVFKYNFTGTTGPNKYLVSTLLDKSCNQTADASLAIVQNVSGNALEVDLDIIQETITSSSSYNENAEGTSATIDFCLRIDYDYKDATTGDVESINFHETTVTITVDLTANFTLASITTNRTAATEDNANANLDYPVEAYYCQDNNGEVAGSVLTQGSLLQFCVRMFENVTADVYVEDIMEFTLSQPGSVPLTAPSRPIVNTQPDPLTEKLCIEMGICNIKHQLSSKWFAVPNPKPLRVDGVAILAFGKASSMPSAAPGNRRLRVPIRGLLSAEQVKAMMERQLEAEAAANKQVALYQPDRKLQAADSPFDLQVDLQSPTDQPTTKSTQGGSNTTVIAIVAVVIALVAGCLLYFFCVKRRSKTVEETKVVSSSYNATTNVPHGGSMPPQPQPGYNPNGSTQVN